MHINTHALLDECNRLAGEFTTLYHCFVFVPSSEWLGRPEPDLHLRQVASSSIPYPAVFIDSTPMNPGGKPAISFYFSGGTREPGNNRIDIVRQFKQFTAACAGLELRWFRDPERKKKRFVVESTASIIQGRFEGTSDQTRRFECEWLEHLYECLTPTSRVEIDPLRPASRYEVLSLPMDTLRASVLALKTAIADADCWSSAKAPSDWAKDFKVSLDTLNRRIEAGLVRVKKDAPKLWRVRLDDLPKE